jgi:putative transcriptional regulator
MTQQQLADAVGARRETIVLIEGGKYNPTLRLAHKIAATLHSTIDDIFLFEDEDGIV